jgi:hypothetical protein
MRVTEYAFAVLTPVFAPKYRIDFLEPILLLRIGILLVIYFGYEHLKWSSVDFVLTIKSLVDDQILSGFCMLGKIQHLIQVAFEVLINYVFLDVSSNNQHSVTSKYLSDSNTYQNAEQKQSGSGDSEIPVHNIFPIHFVFSFIQMYAGEDLHLT